MSITTSSIQQYIGKNLFDESGNKIGKIGGVFLDDTTGQPEWVTVSTGFFGTNESFVPVAGASETDDGLTAAYTKDKVKDAPNVDVDRGHLSSDEEESLYRYYGLQYSDSGSKTDRSNDRFADDNQTTGTTGVAGTTGTRDDADHRGDDSNDYRGDDSNVGRTDLVQRDADYDGDASTGTGAGPDGPDINSRPDASATASPDAMTRSEERLNVGTETVTTGKARLRKYVETEHQQVDVPVRKERVRLETEPITDANRGDSYDGPAISEEEHEVTLREERPVVSTEAVPVERVRLETETEEETRTVSGDVRKERIDLDQP